MCVFRLAIVCASAPLHFASKWKFAMAFDSDGLGTVLVDFFACFLFTRLAFGFLPLRCVCVCVCVLSVSVAVSLHTIALQYFDFSPTHGAHHCRVLSMSLLSSFPLCALWSRCAHRTHTYKQFDYNNKCKFTRCFLYKYDCFINVCHQLESNHRRVKTIRSLLGATK